jgi:hypothetical protein
MVLEKPYEKMLWEGHSTTEAADFQQGQLPIKQRCLYFGVAA